MKKHFILRVLAFAAIALAGISHESTAQDSDSLFVEGGGSGTGGGRSITTNELRVEYVNLFGNGFLIVTVQSDLGLVDFIVTNNDTGEYLVGEFNARSGSYPIPISNSPGHYRAVFMLPDGRFYEKEFTL